MTKVPGMDADTLDHGLWVVVVFRPTYPPARVIGPFASELEAAEWATRKLPQTGLDFQVKQLQSPRVR